MEASLLKSKQPRSMKSVSSLVLSIYNFECVGSFVVQKQQASYGLAHIHSKPIVYTNNGGGRDTYISMNDGGFRPLHRAGHGKSTYYNQLRQYPESAHVARKSSRPSKPCKAPAAGDAATNAERMFKAQEMSRYHELEARARPDDFTDAQNHYNPRFKAEMSRVHNYQNMMDRRLSKPKALDAQIIQRDDRVRVFRNSSPTLQLSHQQVTLSKTAGPGGFKDSTPKRGAASARKPHPAVHAELNVMAGSRTFDKSYQAYGKIKMAHA